MTKRNLATALWFLAGWTAGGMLSVAFGLPGVAAIVPGILLAGLVRWDPTGALWSPSTTGSRSVRPINEVAEELERKAARASSVETERASR